MILTLFINTLSCTVSNIIVFDFLERFFKRKYSCNILIPFLFLTTFQISINMLQNTELNYLYTFIFFFIISKFLYYDEKYNIYLVSFLVICGLMLIETLAFIFINALFKNMISNVFLYGMQVVLVLVLTLLAYYILIKLITKNRININKFSFIEVLMVLLNLLGTFTIVDIASNTGDKKVLFSLLLISICFLVSNIYFIFVIDLKDKIQQLNTKLELKRNFEEVKYKSYIHRLEEIEKEEKYFHDLKNHLSALHYYYQSNQISNAQNYLNKIIDNIPITRRIIENDIVQVILNEHQEDCLQHNIKLTTHINKNLSFDNIDEYDLVTLFTNVLTNAFEAALESEEKVIDIHIDKVNNFTVIKVSNSYNNNIEIKDNIYKSTKKGHKGYGISNSIEAIQKYMGTYSIQYDDNVFIFQFMLPNEIM